MSDSGIKIALGGNSVLSATPGQLAFSSKYPNPKIKRDASPAHFNTVDYTFSSNPGDNTVTTIATIVHGYTYIPKVEVYVKDFQFSPASFAMLQYFINPVDPTQLLYYEVTSVNVVIAYSRDTTVIGPAINVNGFRFIFKYYISAENAA